MELQMIHCSLAVVPSGCILGSRSSHCVCLSWPLRAFRLACGVEVPPTKCSKLGDTYFSETTSVAPFLLGLRQRRSGARLRARGKNVNIMLIMRKRKSAFEPYKYGVSACVANARPFCPGAKHKMLWSESAKTPPARAYLGVVLVQPHTHLPTKFCPPEPPCLLLV